MATLITASGAVASTCESAGWSNAGGVLRREECCCAAMMRSIRAFAGMAATARPMVRPARVYVKLSTATSCKRCAAAACAPPASVACVDDDTFMSAPLA